MADKYEAKIKQINSSAQLVSMLQALRSGNSVPGWPPGKAFEYVLLRAFELEGATVVWPYSVFIEGKQIEQIDGAVYLDHLSCLVEAKDRDSSEGIEPIAKLRNQLMRRPAGTIGLVFTTSKFSIPAVILTQMISPLSILLWGYPEIEHAISNNRICSALKTKYMFAVERGMPDYDTMVMGVR